MQNDQDLLQRLYAQLRALRDNLPNKHPNYPMEWPQVKLYIELLDKLAGIGVDVSDFRIPPSMLTNEVVETNYLTHETAETGRSTVSESYLKTKLDAILTYFELTTDQGTTQVDFNVPERA